MSRKTDLTGMRFGKLTVLEATGEIQERYQLWRCKCDCGNEIKVNTKRLRCVSDISCGCTARSVPSETPSDLTGKRYGMLTVLESDHLTGTQRPSWLCRCDCGNECYVTTYSLLNGKRKSCGCLHRKADTAPARDLTNQVFGRLTVIEPVDDYAGDLMLWKCRCECGAETEVSSEDLLQGIRRSCGCVASGQEKYSGFSREEIPEPRKSRTDNTSGFRGVSRHPDGRWLVSIGLKSNRYYIGLFDDYEEAVRARLRMEEILQKGFEEAYQNWQLQAQRNSAWAEENPFFYKVVKSGKYFRIQTVFGSTMVSAV